MEGWELMAWLGMLVLFGAITAFFLFGSFITFVIRSSRRDRERQLEISQSLGFTPVDPAPELVRKTTQLYLSIRTNADDPDGGKYELRNVFRKGLRDGEMFILDLIDTSGKGQSYTEKQAIAIMSPHLNLPTFAMFPRADIDAALNLGNRALVWVVSNLDQLVEFPHFPEFDQRYAVSSPDSDGTRQFLDDSKLPRLAQTRLTAIHAGGDMFALCGIDVLSRPLTEEMMSQRVDQAMHVFSTLLT